MAILPFARTKRRTPVEYQTAYEAEFRRELKRVAPALVLLPLVAILLGGWFWSYFGLRFGAVLLALAYLFVEVIVWLVFITAAKPRKDEGRRTRQLLDDMRSFERVDRKK